MKQWAKLSIVLLIILIGTTVFSENLKPYPKTRTVDVVDDYFGVKVKDPYRWLENTKSKEVQDWIDAQNKYTDEYMKCEPQRTKILERLKIYRKYNEDSTPTKTIDGKLEFFWRRIIDKDKIVYVMRNNTNGKEKILLDPNKWPPNDVLGEVYPSNNGKFIAFEKSIGGKEISNLFILNTKTGKFLKNKVYGYDIRHVEWLPDDKSFYYSAYPENESGKKFLNSTVFQYFLGENKCVEIFSCKKKKYKSSGNYAEIKPNSDFAIIYSIKSLGENNVYLKELHSQKEPQAFVFGDGGKYYINEYKNYFYIIEISKNHPNGRIFRTEKKKTSIENWELIVPENKDLKINDNDLYFTSNKFFINYLYRASSRIDMFDCNGKYMRTLKLPSLCTAGLKVSYGDQYIYIGTYSFVDRQSYYKYYPEKDKLELYYRRKLYVNYKPEDVEIKQVWYNSKDNTPISMFVVHKKNLDINGKTPVLIKAYGAHGVSQTPSFFMPYAMLIEANGIFCVPNLRGGGEYGLDWYNDGRLRKKQHTFDDLIAGTEWLIKNLKVSTEKIALIGASSGGLTAGTAMVQRPDLFKVVLCAAPILDMLRFPKFGAGMHFIREYGDPNKKNDFQVLYSYSPYQNIKNNVKYPTILIDCSENDTRVGIESALKTCAKLQKNTKNGNVFLQVQKQSGHMGATSHKSRIEYLSKELGFLFHQVGVNLK